MEEKVREQKEEYDRIHQQHLGKKSAEIQTQKRCFNLLKNADGYDPAQDEEDEEEVVILETVGPNNAVGTNISTDVKKEKLTSDELKKLCPNRPKTYKHVTGKYIRKCWKKFETELTSIGRTETSFYNYYHSIGNKALKEAIQQLNNEISEPKSKKSKPSTDDESD
uniref:Uncharacterized protein n=1 Tax=Panagrolaimus davidi TaxID=227884 RepID=A0A914QA49_9BILA